MNYTAQTINQIIEEIHREGEVLRAVKKYAVVKKSIAEDVYHDLLLSVLSSPFSKIHQLYVDGQLTLYLVGSACRQLASNTSATYRLYRNNREVDLDSINEPVWIEPTVNIDDLREECINEVLEGAEWYDKELWKLYYTSEEKFTLSDLNELTRISSDSIYSSIRKTNRQMRNKLNQKLNDGF